ncbi:MAG: ATP-binding cassette domain-containing protein [Candidatus Omnitrophota bacterium]|nr:MAG: ATP-binding cassette domain-containing protein [Candidatus Omnitrophota bacterium]
MKSYLKEYFKLLKFTRPYRGVLALAFLCMGVSTIFDGISLGMIVPVSDRILTNKEIILPSHVPSFVVNLITKLNELEPLVVLKGIVIVIIALFLFKGFFLFMQNYLMNVAGQGVVKEVRNSIYKKFHDLSLDFYSKKRTGELISRITNDVSLITHAISSSLAELIYQSMQLALFTFLAFYLYWKLALVSFVLFPLILFPVVRLGKRIKKFSFEVQNKMADLNSLLAETIQGAYIVKVFNREDYELNRFKKINHHYYKFMLKSIKRKEMLSPITEFIGALGAVVILLVAGKEVIAGKLSFGIFGLFMGSLMSMIKPLKRLSKVHAENQHALAASHRIYDILGEEIKIIEKHNALSINEFKGGIEFSGVWFTYNEEEDFVLKDIKLEVKKGETVALVGHSGAGKSTLVGLIPRLYDSQKGRVLIDGEDVKELKIKDLRSLIAVVSQDLVLFNATVRDNIAYGREGATDQEIEEAAKKAFAYDFIQRLPQGFSTVIGDRGFRLSGGERQRISIARAILRDAPILILDEATSQLDSSSEQLIKEALYNLMKGKTTFVIAHRLSTVQKADKIVVMDKGRIAEEGDHTSLISRKSLYKKLYDLQFNV